MIPLGLGSAAGGGPRRRWTAMVVLALSIGVIVGTAGTQAGRREVVAGVRALGSLNPAYVPVILMLAPSNYALRFVRWQYYVSRLGVRIPRASSAVIFLSGLTMALSPGKAGELAKAYAVQRLHGYSAAIVAPAVIVERIVDGLAMVVLAVVGALATDKDVGFIIGAGPGAGLESPSGSVPTLLGVALLGISVAVGVLRGLGRPWTRGLVRRRLGRWPRLASTLEAVGSSSGTLLGGVPLLLGLGIGILSWGAEGFVLLFTLRAMGQQASAGLSLLATAVSALAGAMSALPGGLGAAELSMVAMLVAAGVRPGEAGTATLISRLSTLWLGVMVGVVATMSLARQIAQSEWSSERQ